MKFLRILSPWFLPIVRLWAWAASCCALRCRDSDWRCSVRWRRSSKQALFRAAVCHGKSIGNSGYMIIMIQSGIIIYLGNNYDTSEVFFFFFRRNLVYVYIYMYMQIGAVFMTVKLQEGTTHLLMVSSSSFNLSDNGNFAGNDSMFWEKRNKFWQTSPRIAELRPKVPCKGP